MNRTVVPVCGESAVLMVRCSASEDIRNARTHPGMNRYRVAQEKLDELKESGASQEAIDAVTWTQLTTEQKDCLTDAIDQDRQGEPELAPVDRWWRDSATTVQ